MHHNILSLFPAHTHPLTLVSDPDGLIAGEAVRFELSRRGFVIVQETDPVILRYQIEQLRPFQVEKPVLLITVEPLENLPYDLWQSGYRIRLSVHDLFPNLAYPVVRTLLPDQLERLALCQQPAEVLGRQKTTEYLLRQIFNVNPEDLLQPHHLIAWLARYHQNRSPMPGVIRDGLVERLRRFHEYRSWDLLTILNSPEGFQQFLDTQWTAYINQQTGKAIAEQRSSYLLSFEKNEALQDLLPELVRKQALTPVELEPGTSIPDWARWGTVEASSYSDLGLSLLAELQNELREKSSPNSVMAWNEWKQIAELWARMNEIWQNTTAAAFNLNQREAYTHLAENLDQTFLAWLQPHYSALGAQRLPVPKHVFHIPHFLAYQRSIGAIQKFALLVLDGLSLTDWFIIAKQWKSRHPAWSMQTDMLLAQVPSITSISRHALISGLRPADFASDLEHIPSETRAWEVFWMRQNVPNFAIACQSLALDRSDISPDTISHRLEGVCFIENTIDEITHSSVLGAASQQAALRVWIDPASQLNSKRMEDLIEHLLARSFTIFVASDHGHVEAKGIGQPTEGLLAQTRGKRARLYQDRRAAQRVQQTFPDTILWENDGLLPEQFYALMPNGRTAFTTPGETVVTHGGVTIDEMIVPFVQIK